MSPAAGVWLEFAVCAGLIGIAGSRLSRYGDVIADKTGLSGTWVGLILLATVTSLPELITGISAASLTRLPDIALGNVFGACVFNLFMLVVLDFLHRGEPVYTRASQGHILSAGFGIILIGFVAFNLLLARHGTPPGFGHVGAYSLVIVLIYAIAVRTVFRYESNQMAELAERHADRYPGITLHQAVLRYTLYALVVMGAGLWLPFVSADLAQAMGWHVSFVGTVFVAFATTLPEMVVTIAALRLGALDMAISNLLGSNLFNIVIIAVSDAFFTSGPILSYVSPVHVVSAVSALMMTGIVIVGLLYRSRTRLFRTVGWTSLFLLVIYLFNSYVLYLYGG